ncbi:MAG: hypothetical protein AB9880_01725 [Christensenellales bacterium]
MPYVAHAGVQLLLAPLAYEINTWYHIKTIGDTDYRWRLSGSMFCEVVAGTFTDKYEALKCAKQIYVTLIYSLLRGQHAIVDAGCDFYETRLFHTELDGSIDEYSEREAFFFWNRRHTGKTTGPAVYEVESTIDDFCTYRFLHATIRSLPNRRKLDFQHIDETIFTYCREAQQLLSSVVLADQTNDDGMKMTLYCSLLEHISDDVCKGEGVITEIDALIHHVMCSDLSDNNKAQMRSFLNTGKNISSRQKCRSMVYRHAKRNYLEYTPMQIFDAAYSVRNMFAHGQVDSYDKHPASCCMKFVVLDIIAGYFAAKELVDI